MIPYFAVTPITPLTEYSHPFKGTHELSPMAAGTPGANQGQWPQELDEALDNMGTTGQAFLGRYDLLEGSTRLRSPQGIVQFATCKVTKQQVRVLSLYSVGSRAPHSIPTRAARVLHCSLVLHVTDVISMLVCTLCFVVQLYELPCTLCCNSFTALD